MLPSSESCPQLLRSNAVREELNGPFTMDKAWEVMCLKKTGDSVHSVLDIESEGCMLAMLMMGEQKKEQKVNKLLPHHGLFAFC